MVSGEMAYLVQVNDYARIMIRSSIDESGIAASAGEDSIRMWIERKSETLGWKGMKKIGNYTTRTKGWDYRIVDRLRELGCWLKKSSGWLPSAKTARRRRQFGS